MEPQAPNLPRPHGIYRYEAGEWAQLKDMTARSNYGITLGQIAMCPDGHIYVAASVEFANCPDGPIYVDATTDADDLAGCETALSHSSILQLEENNDLTLLGNYVASFDPLSVACAPSGTLYVIAAEGIYAIRHRDEARPEPTSIPPTATPAP